MSSQSSTASAAIQVEKDRTELLHRLRRAEGQVRGIQRMLEGGEDCLKIGAQFSAVRKALDSTYIHMSLCFLKQNLQNPRQTDSNTSSDTDDLLKDYATLLSRLR
ncbi:MAG: hypothetical protein CFE44_06180 [Burkholderiales bacterium PBB4]|nr:MAG: hypothetical protein CFE44_06180 [Burkholderiales bacterium PBB4]